MSGDRRDFRRMAIIADDVTGANDIGSMFAKADYLTHVYSIMPDGGYTYDAAAPVQPDVCILDTNSRLDNGALAYDKVFAATRQLRQAGWRQFFNKTCSVFRGNIGAEFDAMLDALDESFAVVVLGFPKNGRRTIEGIHYVHGRPLAESEFRNDPIHPMTESNLVKILQAQTERHVSLLTHKVVAQGAAPLRREIDALRGRTNYVILDVADQEALAIIARAVHNLPVLCGSSALGEELPPVWGPLAPPPPPALPARNGLGILCTAGSLMPQTVAQIDHLRAQGTALFPLDSARLFDTAGRVAEQERLIAAVADELLAGRDAVVHSPNSPEGVQATRALGEAQGFAPTEVARLVSTALAAVTAGVVARSGQQRLVIAGGETAAAVCNRLGVSGLRVWQEIQPGLPSCLSLTSPPLLLVLKSGSFGSVDFLEQAMEHVRCAEEEASSGR